MTNRTGFYQGKMLKQGRGNVVITAAMFWLWLCCSSIALAEKKEPIIYPEEFYNPLEIKKPDPLLPRSVADTPLSPIERLKLMAALERLNAGATVRLAVGNKLGAFAIWNRELRLRRALGALEEVKALGRVGALAWSENQSLEVEVITARLQEIQTPPETDKPMVAPVVDLELLQALGTAYQQVRSPKQAVEVYEQILAGQRQQQDSAAIEATLKTLAELHLSWFDYPKAATAYEELLSLARAKSDRLTEVTYLQQLAYIYEQKKQHEQAAVIKQQLAELYLNEQDFTKVPQLRLAIASDLQSLGQLKEAFQNYQEAYASAWSLQQYARAADALRKLIALYRTQGQIDEALQTSQILLEADRLANNSYGLMNTYDELGKIYLERGNYPEALTAFQSGLQVAQLLKYQEAYFAQQIEQVNQKIPK